MTTHRALGSDPRAVEAAVVGMYSAHPSPSHKDKLAFASRRMKIRLHCCGIDEPDYKGKRVLDAGCGTGEYSCWFAAQGADVLGIDLSDGSLAEARAYAADTRLSNLTFEKRSVLDTGLPDESFDLIYCTGVLHHIANSFEGFRELTRLLRPEGKILISLYNKVAFTPRGIRRRVARRLGGRDLAKRVKWGRRLFPRVTRELTDPDRNDPESGLYDYFAIPYESYHTIGQVLKWFDSQGLEYVGSFAPATFRDYPAMLHHQSYGSVEKTFQSPLVRLASRLSPQGELRRKRPSMASRASIQLVWMVGGLGMWCMAGRKMAAPTRKAEQPGSRRGRIEPRSGGVRGRATT